MCDEWDATGTRRHKLYTMHDGGGRALVERTERRYDGSTTALFDDLGVPARAWEGWLQFGLVVDETGTETAPSSVAFTGDDLGDDVIARLAERIHGSTDPWLELITGVQQQWGSAKTTAVGIGLGPSPKLNIYVAPTAGAVAAADSPQRPAPRVRATEGGVADLAPIGASFAGLAGMHQLAADLAERRLPG